MKVRIVEEVARELQRWSEIAAPLETGGILIGLYAEGDPWITEAVLIDDAARSSSRYELPAGVTQAIVSQARERDQRLGYIGDWHSHPVDVGPSPTDLRSLRAMVQRATGGGHRPPVIVVLRRKASGWALDGRMGLRWPFGTRPVDILETGTASPGSTPPQVGSNGSARTEQAGVPESRSR